ncbi:MAG: NADH-quinone oxidoreductase subunit N [Chloroflexi bacterium]|nr:NADH-quinone oxidoreductase subunit N [Chloroflexota bacterium]MYF65863.1 NADH-quinone oxidoreductase subunit N [Chloroflexota bacterium]
MGITGKDLFLIAPELALVVAATVVVLSGLVSRQRQLTLGLALLGLAATFAFGIALWDDVHANGAQSAFNDSLIVDKFALYIKFLVAGTAALVLIAGLEYAERFRPYESEFSGLVLFSASGLMLLAAAADLITIYVSLELATLPVVALAAFVRMRVAPIEAGVKYLLLSAVSSAFLLYGFAFLYGASGTMQVVSSGSAPTIAQSLAAGTAAVPFGGLAVMAGAVLATAGFGFKLSMVPFQMWTPDVYEGAPTPVGAFLATASKAAAFAVVLRLFYEALGGSSADWSTLFAVLAAITMTIGNLVAIVQSNVKRLLGYSAIAHAGYMLIGVAAVTAHGQETPDASGISSVLFYLAGYAAMTLAAFFAVLVLTQHSGDERIEAMAGIGKRAPLAALALAVALLGLTGIPPTVGFMGKLFLFNAAVNSGLVWLAVVGAVNSVVSAYYYVGIIRTMYLRQPTGEATPIAAAFSGRLALVVTLAAILVLGFWPGGLLEVARTAASGLVS